MRGHRIKVHHSPNVTSRYTCMLRIVRTSHRDWSRFRSRCHLHEERPVFVTILATVKTGVVLVQDVSEGKFSDMTSYFYHYRLDVVVAGSWKMAPGHSHLRHGPGTLDQLLSQDTDFKISASLLSQANLSISQRQCRLRATMSSDAARRPHLMHLQERPRGFAVLQGQSRLGTDSLHSPLHVHRSIEIRGGSGLHHLLTRFIIA